MLLFIVISIHIHIVPGLKCSIFKVKSWHRSEGKTLLPSTSVGRPLIALVTVFYWCYPSYCTAKFPWKLQLHSNCQNKYSVARYLMTPIHSCVPVRIYSRFSRNFYNEPASFHLPNTMKAAVSWYDTQSFNNDSTYVISFPQISLVHG